MQSPLETCIRRIAKKGRFHRNGGTPKATIRYTAHMRATCGLWLMIILLPLLGPSAFAAEPTILGDRASDASLRLIRKAMAPQQDGDDLLILFSLRQLGDPSLKSFFHQLAQQGGPVIRVHAILGLGEISENSQVDPQLISQLDSPQARYTVIANSLQMNFLSPEQIKLLLEDEQLEARPRITLMAEQVSNGKEVDKIALERLAGNSNYSVAGLAACLLAQLGDKAYINNYHSTLKAVSSSSQERHLSDLFRAIRQYRLTEALTLIDEALMTSSSLNDVVLQGLTTMLMLDPVRGASYFSRYFAGESSYANQVRYALLLLEVSAQVPIDVFDLLPADDQLLSSLASAGRAVRRGTGASKPLIELLKLRHYRASRWALRTAKDLDSNQATEIYQFLLSSVDTERDRQDERAEMAMIAAARLFEINPQAVIDRLLDVVDDSLTQEAILMGLLDSPSPEAGIAASQVKRIGYGRADSLALILIAKHATKLSSDELRDLGVIASGGASVSDILQAQAAWLYLKHSNLLETALAAVFADT